jgi:hypothetical protein
MSLIKETQTLYFTDAPGNSIYSYHYDEAYGRFFFSKQAAGLVSTFWMAVWSNWTAVCVSPLRKLVAGIILLIPCIAVRRQYRASVHEHLPTAMTPLSDH